MHTETRIHPRTHTPTDTVCAETSNAHIQYTYTHTRACTHRQVDGQEHNYIGGGIIGKGRPLYWLVFFVVVIL